VLFTLAKRVEPSPQDRHTEFKSGPRKFGTDEKLHFIASMSVTILKSGQWKREAMEVRLALSGSLEAKSGETRGAEGKRNLGFHSFCVAYQILNLLQMVCAQSMCVIFILAPMLRALSCWTLATASVVTALDSPIWGRGEEWIAKKLNKDQNATAPEDSCILGEQWGCNDDEVAAGLTNQIISELNGMGYSFSGLDSNWVHCSFPCYLQSGAASNLVSAAQSVNDYITLNSAFRSSAQQYLLYRWYNNGMCGIGLAAAPGTSNHESGRAIDTSYYNYWLNTLQNYGWAHNYPSNDPVHFDYTNVPDISSQNLLAFQRLWNRYNPGSRIDEDGIYGPQTSNALYWSPCGGW
jgi:hypothetical protein